MSIGTNTVAIQRSRVVACSDAQGTPDFLQYLGTIATMSLEDIHRYIAKEESVKSQMLCNSMCGFQASVPVHN